MSCDCRSCAPACDRSSAHKPPRRTPQSLSARHFASAGTAGAACTRRLPSTPPASGRLAHLRRPATAITLPLGSTKIRRGPSYANTDVDLSCHRYTLRLCLCAHALLFPNRWHASGAPATAHPCVAVLDALRRHRHGRGHGPPQLDHHCSRPSCASPIRKPLLRGSHSPLRIDPSPENLSRPSTDVAPSGHC